MINGVTKQVRVQGVWALSCSHRPSDFFFFMKESNFFKKYTTINYIKFGILFSILVNPPPPPVRKRATLSGQTPSAGNPGRAPDHAQLIFASKIVGKPKFSSLMTSTI